MLAKLKSQAGIRGAIFLLLGVAATITAAQYQMGVAADMGPGYLPSILGGGLALMGIVNIVHALRTGSSEVPKIALTGLIFTMIGLAGFALLIGSGLIPAILALVVFSAFAHGNVSIKETIVVFVVLALVTGTLFVFGLGQPASYLFWRQ